MSDDTRKRLIALAIGLGTIMAGVFSWRAGQIGSAANFNDRTSIGQQIDQENIRIDVAIEAARQGRQYDRYVADYAVADAFDDTATRLRAEGDVEGATDASAEADRLREAATTRSFASEVFGEATLANPSLVTPEPRPFDIEQRIEELYTAATTGLTSKGELNPQQWADESDAIRARMRSLTHWVALLLTGVVLLTLAEVTVSSRLRVVALPLGTVILVAAAAGGLTMAYWA